MHLTHIKLKPTRKIDTDFNPVKIGEGIDVPKKSIEFSEKYRKSKKYSDDDGFDILFAFEDHLIFGFDFVNNGEKLLIPEINPTTIFFSNAVMSHRKLIDFRNLLFQNSPTVKNFQKPINPNHFGNFFQLASNCVINLQSTLESFTNRLIPENYEFIDSKGDKFDPSIFHKLDKTLPLIKEKKFRTKFKQDNMRIRQLIELRNEIIHLKPISEKTNTKYKVVYRRLLKFDFTKSILSVRNLVNFYEPDLIEECDCEKEFFYDINEQIK